MRRRFPEALCIAASGAPRRYEWCAVEDVAPATLREDRAEVSGRRPHVFESDVEMFDIAIEDDESLVQLAEDPVDVLAVVSENACKLTRHQLRGLEEGLDLFPLLRE